MGADPVRRETFIARTVRGWGESITVDAAAPAHSRDADLRDWFGRMERLAVGPAAVEPAMRVIGETDVREILPLIRVPTLVARRRDDARVDRRHAEHIRDHVAGARFVELPRNLWREPNQLATGESTGSDHLGAMLNAPQSLRRHAWA